MTVVEIGLSRNADRWANVGPFTFEYTVNVRELAFFWTNIFGCPDETSDDTVNILATYIGVERLLRTTTKEACLSLFKSFFFDYPRQKIRVNFGPTINPLLSYTIGMKINMQYAIGFCDKKVVYIDELACLPFLKSTPTVKHKLDIIGNQRMAMSSGSLNLGNLTGDLDFMKRLTLFNNDVIVYDLDDDARDEYTRDDLNATAYMLVNNVAPSAKEVGITLQDVRNTFNTKVPKDLFPASESLDDDLVNKPVPLCYGPCAVIPAICMNGKVKSGPVAYYSASGMTSLGDVQVLIGDTWTSVTPTGGPQLFTLSEADGRGGPDNDARACRLVGCVGKAISRITDIIVDLDNQASGIPPAVIADYYDVDEWNAEAATISTGGFYLAEQKPFLDVIKELQDGANKRFRYEINAENKRTIRIDDNDRAAIMFVPKEKILENETFEMETDREAVFANLEINYARNYEADSSLRVVDSSKQSEVIDSIRSAPTKSYDTLLQTEALALERAAREAEMLGRVWFFLTVTLIGREFKALRITDVIEIELELEDREWMGIWRAKVTELETKDIRTKTRLQLLERIPYEDENRILKVDHEGSIKVADTTDIIKVAK